MEPNPYDAPKEQGYKPPSTPLLSDKQAVWMFVGVCGGVMLLVPIAQSFLPPQILGVDQVWVVAPTEIALIFMLLALLKLGRAAGIVAKPRLRSRM